MKIIVTAGPTYEVLDEVRRLTNRSTGRLGTGLARHFLDRGWEVTLLRGSASTFPCAISCVPFSTTASLDQTLQSQASNAVDAVFHAAAVSDFRFGKIQLKKGKSIQSIQSIKGIESIESMGKLPTSLGALWVELIPTQKIISKLRRLFPNALIIGWKYEVDGTRADAFEKARAQIAENHTNLCVLNGSAYGNGYALLQKNGTPQHIENEKELYDALHNFVQTHQHS